MHNTNKQITILLPFYKVGNEFDAAIDSIVKQSHEEWELLLINNNSNAFGAAIANKWTMADSRIHLIEEPNQGIAYALNTGLKHCKSPYIARMDADDISHPERLKVQSDFLENNAGIDAVSSQANYQSAIPGSEGYSLFVDWQNSIITPDEHALYRFIESPLAHPGILFRKDLIEQYGPYSIEPVPEDYEMWLRWMDHGIRIHKIPQKLLTWNDHAERLSRTHENYSREAFFQVKCKYLASWIKRNMDSSKKIVVCGSSRIGRKRAAMLEEYGVDIFGFTDVKKRPNRQVNFIPLTGITEPAPWFLINFIARRGVGQSIRAHFSSLGFKEGADFILAA